MEAIEPLQEDFAAESKYKPNDLVVYQNTALLLKSPFNQLEPASWIKVPEANINQANGIHSIERRAEQKVKHENTAAKKDEEDEKTKIGKA